METLVISTYEQRLKCKYCPNRDNCPFLKRQERVRVKQCTWHNYTSAEYGNFARELWKVDANLAQKHYKLRTEALNKTNEEMLRQFNKQMEEIKREAEQRRKGIGGIFKNTPCHHLWASAIQEQEISGRL